MIMILILTPNSYYSFLNMSDAERMDSCIECILLDMEQCEPHGREGYCKMQLWMINVTPSVG